MALITLRTENSARGITLTVARNPRVIAAAIRKFARSRGVSPLSVDYHIG